MRYFISSTRPVAAAAAAVFALGGCGTSDGTGAAKDTQGTAAAGTPTQAAATAKTYPGVKQLRDDLTAKGVVCDKFSEATPDEIEPPMTAGASCMVKNDSLPIFLAADAAGVEKLLTQMKDGALTKYSVAGPNWVVGTDSKPLADSVFRAIGGNVAAY